MVSLKGIKASEICSGLQDILQHKVISFLILNMDYLIMVSQHIYLLLKIPEVNNAVIKCELCGFEAVYKRHIKYDAYLEIDIGDDKKYEYKIPGDIIIGRNRRYKLSMKDQFQNIEEVIPIRILEVSLRHSLLYKKERLEIKDIDGTSVIVSVPYCVIEDLGSKNGTQVNNTLLTDKKTLEHGSRIVLAPNCDKYVVMEYKIRRSN